MSSYFHYLLPSTSDLKSALNVINQNEHKLAIIFDPMSDKVIGTITDGDCRRHLLEGGTLDSSVLNICNQEFHYVNVNDSSDKILKIFDRNVRAIPVLNDDLCLVGVKSFHDFGIQSEIDKTCVRVPVRVSFGGGGSDTSQYIKSHIGCVLSSSISIYAYCCLERVKQSFAIELLDYNLLVQAKTIEELLVKISVIPEFKLVHAIVTTLRPNFSFRLKVHSEFSPQSGLGGSSAICVGVVKAFAELMNLKINKMDLVSLCYHIERQVADISGGWQDQYAAVFGGINFIEFDKNGDQVTPLNLEDACVATLESSVLLVDVEGRHSSSEIHEEQKRNTENPEIMSLISKNVVICHKIKSCLLKSEFKNVGRLMNESWGLKKQFASSISSEKIDALHAELLEIGIHGAKLLGAGGAGKILIMFDSFKRHEIIRELKIRGLMFSSVKIDENGATVLFRKIRNGK